MMRSSEDCDVSSQDSCCILISRIPEFSLLSNAQTATFIMKYLHASKCRSIIVPSPPKLSHFCTVIFDLHVGGFPSLSS